MTTGDTLHRTAADGRAGARDSVRSSAAVAVPRLSATVVALRVTGDDRFRVLVIRRSRTLRVLPGFIAFPGGVLDDVDRVVADHWSREKRSLWPAVPATFAVDMPEDLAQATYWSLISTALRETMEETGARLFGSVTDESRTPPTGGVAASGVAARESANWLLTGCTAVPDRRLRYIGRRVTPAVFERRFDAHYFVTELFSADTFTPAADEVEDILFASPSELLQSDERIAPPTRDVLRLLAGYKTASAVLAEALLPPQPDDETRARELRALGQYPS
jgi:8-oxo-dGTP pyrophosphatase MutT (NUDIX family)